jgi:hypothetical protein
MEKDDFRYLIEYAIKAPSGHNTHPWKFENILDCIVVHPDFSRALPVVDEKNYELYIALGCALENLLIAATQIGYQYAIQYPDSANDSIKVEFKKGENQNTTKDKLFDYIGTRQVTKTKYNNQKVSKENLQKLKSCFTTDGVSLLILDSKKNFEKVIPFIIEANNLQFNNKDFVNELVSWIRFSKSEAEKTKDGIWSATMGMPGLGRILGSMIMKNFVSAKSETKRLQDLLNHSQGLAFFISDENNPSAWVKTGRAFQRFGLTATQLSISHAHLNMPCEVLQVRKKLATELGVANQHPLLLIRYGYTEKMPYSFRRPFNEVLENE